MNIILFDGVERQALLPFTYTRPVAEIRIGIMTITEKWQHTTGCSVSHATADYLSVKYPINQEESNHFVNGCLIPTEALLSTVKRLENGQGLWMGDRLLAYVAQELLDETQLDSLERIAYTEPLLSVDHTWDIFAKNGEALALDFELLTHGRTSAKISDTNTVIGDGPLFVEEGADIECTVLNTKTGPIYIGKDTLIMEGSFIRGPFALGEGSIIKMGAKIYGPTTFGPNSKVSGEVNNAVIFGNSSKGHEGYLGNSVLGEWCNIGADSNTSNLKNNYAEVKLWDYGSGRFTKTGLQFCGLMMGDHSKCGINTMFNTGTVIGVNTNIFGTGFPRNFVPSFSWGGAAGFTTYLPKKAFEVAEVVLNRRGLAFDQVEADILNAVFELTKIYRKDG
ncbi:GlmU family protein [Sediminicola luteus]|uniref:Glucose-1-phosphate thymidylyltransferase n=1 Tax=Sediminicola luteus TaxID=319238 RepID=A0A2A4G3Z6_9FLAO|nr:GlmU family protein [Sediminicola luteus]PCE62455.1 glucose-1-phosphate thymidylyltransferase [Sediminicola luteus]